MGLLFYGMEVSIPKSGTSMPIVGHILQKRNTIWLHLIKNHPLMGDKSDETECEKLAFLYSFHLALIRDVIVGMRNMYALTLGNH